MKKTDYGYTKEDKSTVYVGVVLDESGSMGSARASTISSFNEYISGLKADGNTYKMTVMKFDTGRFPILFNNESLGNVKLTEHNYHPNAGTPLYDAIGKMVSQMESVPEGASVFFVVLTDGEENESREFNKEKITALLKDKQEKAQWTMVYLGANQDAWAVGSNLGFNNNFTFHTTKMGSTMGAVREVTTLYASSGGSASGMNTGSAAMNSAFNASYNGDLGLTQTTNPVETPKKLTKNKKKSNITK